jgi:tight adherence protein B
MRLGLLLPLLMLAMVVAAGVLLFTTARQQKLLRQRIEVAVPTGEPVADDADDAPNLRVRQPRSARLAPWVKLLKMPLDLPQANVLSPVLIFSVSTAAALGIGWTAHVLIGWLLSILVVLVVWLVLVRSVFGWEVAAYQAKLVKQLPDTVQLVVSATRAGLPVSAAFRAVAEEMPSPTCNEFVRVDNELALGLPPEEALLNLHRRTGVTEYAIFAVTIGVQSRAGGRLAETIQNLADTVRERLAIAGRARALAGEAKTSATIMAVLPVVSGLVLAIVEPEQLAPLINDPRGQRMLAFGIGSLLTGIVVMRQMIRGATKE